MRMAAGSCARQIALNADFHRKPVSHALLVARPQRRPEYRASGATRRFLPNPVRLQERSKLPQAGKTAVAGCSHFAHPLIPFARNNPWPLLNVLSAGALLTAEESVLLLRDHQDSSWNTHSHDHSSSSTRRRLSQTAKVFGCSDVSRRLESAAVTHQGIQEIFHQKPINPLVNRADQRFPGGFFPTFRQ